MSYWRATRHPAPCLFFIAPLLVAYELGVVAVGGSSALAVRNGADSWLRWAMGSCGLDSEFLAPLAVFGVLFAWAWRNRNDAPDEAPGLIVGMALESIGFAVGLWALSRAFGPMLDALGIQLATPGSGRLSTSPFAQVVTYLGAGIYEETIFRLGLFSGVTAALGAALLPTRTVRLVAALSSALAFAAIHHLGAHGESVNGYVFAFRVIAGLLFTVLFLVRGFGIAVGTHAFYDVLVGIPF
jgi:membrane protease YdiL (CAAX protease family)